LANTKGGSPGEGLPQNQEICGRHVNHNEQDISTLQWLLPTTGEGGGPIICTLGSHGEWYLPENLFKVFRFPLFISKYDVDG